MVKLSFLKFSYVSCQSLCQEGELPLDKFKVFYSGHNRQCLQSLLYSLTLATIRFHFTFRNRVSWK